MATSNFSYLTSMVVLDTIYSTSPSHCMLNSCSAIHTSPTYKDEVTARIGGSYLYCNHHRVGGNYPNLKESHFAHGKQV